ncbi:hypothetical protein [Vibrio vulnificus]|uniref:hypothetical protein n=1 Tax=Vibrio vulnificus TaxID=672 RepID=UPI00287AF825|nr:hypothetical protein [Vibrio vulnificus]MDS1873121.1 hypothetical protein [Vibrio vulnificus]
MNSLKNIVEKHEVSDARNAFYYLSRYLKQAAFYEEYQKDIFEDGYRSEPSEKSKELTLCMIEFIETAQQKKANEFSDTEYLYWMGKISEVESSLDPEPSFEIIEAAESAIDDIFFPSTDSKNT